MERACEAAASFRRTGCGRREESLWRTISSESGKLVSPFRADNLVRSAEWRSPSYRAESSAEKQASLDRPKAPMMAD
ncbi:hypothetical protein E2C01_083834 [Portunus trituberculatus]|uniref:Uncharacterized protein n=1 Tax=Portunus trituberculatus TaxID=210409 RepID=A0A5B7IW82_PORTR|nr:hypothetical protein [Portunus trituberculatus]